MIMDPITCCFTGHRPQKLPFGFSENSPACQALKEALLREIVYLIEGHHVVRFLTGMALGVDQWAAEAVLSIKSDYPSLQLDAILPCRTQAGRWTGVQQTRYREILRRCDHTVVLRENYTPSCMQIRNRYMVDHSTYVLAVWDGTPGDTGSTVEYALRKERKVLHIAPGQPPTTARFLPDILL